MDILVQLGVDASVLKQFVIVFIMFLILKFLFFNKLQFVIETREEKTVKLESSADDAFEEVNKLGNEYKEKMQVAQVSIQSNINDEKSKIVSKLDSKYKEEEAQMEKYIESSRKEIAAEIAAKKSDILSKTDELADQLVQKIIQ